MFSLIDFRRVRMRFKTRTGTSTCFINTSTRIRFVIYQQRFHKHINVSINFAHFLNVISERTPFRLRINDDIRCFIYCFFTRRRHLLLKSTLLKEADVKSQCLNLDDLSDDHYKSFFSHH